MTFRFRAPFWEEDEKLKSAGFLISQDKQFFAWWTTHLVISPVLTGWMAGSAAERFRATGDTRIVAAFFRGAYSYAPVDGIAARNTLSEPLQGTPLFACEATERNGHSATVHGAIASGVRAARLVQAVRQGTSRGTASRML